MLIIGYGNRDRGDDGAGVSAAEQLRENGIPAQIHRGDALVLIDLWQGAEKVILIDAVTAGAPAGTVHSWNINEILSAEGPSASTHDLGLAQAIGLARSLGRLPNQLHLYAIEGRNFDIGDDMSAEVKSAVQKVVSQIVALAKLDAGNTICHKD